MNPPQVSIRSSTATGIDLGQAVRGPHLDFPIVCDHVRDMSRATFLVILLNRVCPIAGN